MTHRGRRFISRETAQIALVGVMGICLGLAIVVYPASIIWNRQPIGNAAAIIADVLGTGFSFAFFGALVLALLDQREREAAEVVKKPTCRVDRVFQ